MNKPNNYDNARSYRRFEQLAPGAYVCKTIGVEEMLSKNGKQMVKIALDITEGDEAGRFRRMFDGDTSKDKKWPTQAVMHQLVLDNEGECNGGFKAFVETIEHNNNTEVEWGPGFTTWAKNKLLGVLFRKEEYIDNQGNSKWSVKPFTFCDVQDIREGKVSVPKDKPLDGSSAPATMPSTTSDPIPSGFAAIDEDVPF